MCGIVGYAGWRNAADVLYDGLSRLEYRGYDSSGVAIALKGDGVFYARAEGKLKNLEPRLKEAKPEGHVGIGHTRWATHGRPSERNAHPHRQGKIFGVHNGILENSARLRAELEREGSVFSSDTDTEVFVALLERAVQGGDSQEQALFKNLRRISGSYAFLILFEEDPSYLWAARSGSPLVIGFGEGEMIVASDVPALLPYTRRVLYLEDGEAARISADHFALWKNGERVSDAELKSRIETVTWSEEMAQKGGYKHFMLKEIFEQPEALGATLSGRFPDAKSPYFFPELAAIFAKEIDRVYLVGCGTSYHAALIGGRYIERFAGVRSAVEYASEFRYRDLPLGDRDFVLGISQSGETIDTLYALKKAKEAGAKTAVISNVVGSTICRAVDLALYTRAGPEVSVASTKAFTAQLLVLLMVALDAARARDAIGASLGNEIASVLSEFPRRVENFLAQWESIGDLADRYASAPFFFYIARGPLYPLALEGALKLKEISYIPAQGSPAGELKHGMIALIEEGTPVFAILGSEGGYAEKVISNMEEVAARGARVIAVAPESAASHLPPCVSERILYPDLPWYLEPIMAIIPLQLFAYAVADKRGTDVDQPRNLAKSVTVE